MRPAVSASRVLNGLVAATMIVAMLSTSCGKDARPPLRIGINPWPGYEYFYLAQELGYFTDAGLDARIVEFTSLADTRRAFERGQLDGMFATLVEMLQARQNCARLPQVVVVTDYSNGGDMIIAGAGVGTVADLRGRRVGVEPGSLNCYVLARALEIAGLDYDDVVSVPMAPATMEQALAAGRVDAVVVYPPVSVHLLADSRWRKLFSSADIPGEVLDVLLIDADVQVTRRSDIERLLKAYGRAVAWADGHGPEAFEIMARRESLPADEFAAILKDDIRLVRLDEQAPFFVPGGLIERACAGTEAVLRTTGHLVGRPRSVGPVAAGPFAGHAISATLARP